MSISKLLAGAAKRRVPDDLLLPSVSATYEMKIVDTGDGVLRAGTVWILFEVVRSRMPEGVEAPKRFRKVFNPTNMAAIAVLRRWLEKLLGHEVASQEAAQLAYEAIWGPTKALNGKLVLIEAWRHYTRSGYEVVMSDLMGYSDGVSQLPVARASMEKPPEPVGDAEGREVVPPPPPKERKHGDPGYCSPKSLADSRFYKRVDSHWPTTPGYGWEVFVHCGTETLWKASYFVRLDDSDYDIPTEWTEVKPEKKTITEYNPV